MTRLAPELSLEEFARHAVDFWLTTEDLPLPDNRVTVDRSGAIHLAYRSTNDESAERLYRELRTILNHVGMAAHHMPRRATTTSRRTSGSRASPTRPAPAASAATPPRRSST